MVSCAPRPATFYRAEPKGDRKTGPAPYQPRAPRSPQRGRRGGGGTGESPTGGSGRTEASSPRGRAAATPSRGTAEDESPARSGRPPPHRRPAPSGPPGTTPRHGTREGRGGGDRREPARTKRGKARLRRATRGAARKTAARARLPRGPRPGPTVAGRTEAITLPWAGAGTEWATIGRATTAGPGPGAGAGPRRAEERGRGAGAGPPDEPGPPYGGKAPQAGGTRDERGTSPHPAAHADPGTLRHRTTRRRRRLRPAHPDGREQLPRPPGLPGLSGWAALWPARDSGPQRDQGARDPRKLPPRPHAQGRERERRTGPERMRGTESRRRGAARSDRRAGGDRRRSRRWPGALAPHGGSAERGGREPPMSERSER